MAKPTQQEQVDCVQRCIDTLEILLNHGSKSDVKQHELACMRAIHERISGQAQPPTPEIALESEQRARAANLDYIGVLTGLQIGLAIEGVHENTVKIISGTIAKHRTPAAPEPPREGKA